MKDRWAPRHDSQKVDLVFIVDCTGSMGSYIQNTQRQVRNIVDTISRTAFNTRLALIEYRDHPPQDKSFVTRVHDLTDSVEQMKSWVDAMRARGGGDCPESVADGLEAATKLTYRPDATKMCILIADAPPHGLDTQGDGFPHGCPHDLDPLVSCRKMAEMGITLYCAGCEPAILQYRDFFMGLAHITGGQYVPLAKANNLSKVIINGTLEEVSMEHLMGYVGDWLELEVMRLHRLGKVSTSITDLADDLHKYLHITNNKCQQLQLDDKAPEPANYRAQLYSGMKNMASAKSFWQGHQDFTDGRRAKNGQDSGVVTIIGPTVISKPQSERLVRKALAQKKVPVTHCEETDQIVADIQGYKTMPECL